mgnify:CR=1 FL=1
MHRMEVRIGMSGKDIAMNKIRSEKLVVGVLAHVDAGKTTLAEGLLYLSGKLRKLGRVDHKDAFLDTYELERSRGITIFSKQAELNLGDKKVTLLDTPGHVDFSAEMERTLQVLDYAVLIVSGADGAEGHVQTLWKLLKRYQIPTFLFVNKMDQEGTDKQRILEEVRGKLSENCMDFGIIDGTWNLEDLALCDEKVMEYYLEHGMVTREQIIQLIRERKVFPCYFGSALKLWGVEEFIQGFAKYTEYPEYPKDFGARIFKISRDAQGNRLTHMKITGGGLKVKTLLTGQAQWEEKADQIRVYSGDGYELVQEVSAGTVCTVTGLTKAFAGEGLGAEASVNLPLLEPVLSYRVIPPEDCNLHTLLQQLRQLEEEEPLLQIVWKEETEEIHAKLMGEVQIEILKTMIEERFHVQVEFGSGSIVYKETILELVEGVGHFEPLRHYAEVHLLLEPGELGSGLVFGTACSEDVLDKNWQRLILTHLEEKQHRGVLTGSEITDMKITLVAGRAHPKHTEGGDFRQATYRAVRHGLKMGKSCLLEPVYEYRLEVPGELVGRAMADIQRMQGTFRGPEFGAEQEDMAVLTGTAPVAAMQGYPAEVISYTRGKGRLFCSLKGYEPCHNQEEVLEAVGYDSERDVENPTGSVFCAHGAGFVVDYSQVYDYMHLDGVLAKKAGEPETWESGETQRGAVNRNGDSRRESKPQSSFNPELHDDKELDAIFRRTYGEIRQERKGWARKVSYRQNLSKEGGGSEDGSWHTKGKSGSAADEKEYLLVDGYNIIFGWEELNDLARRSMDAARTRLMDILCNYQGYRKNVLILVFDAYKVEGNPGSSQEYHNIHVVYTKEAETADQYIEKVTHEIGRKHKVTVATSDALEQVIILGQGARRMSAKGLKEEVEAANMEIRGELASRTSTEKNYLFQELPEDMAGEMEDIRLGRDGQKQEKR